MASPTNNLGPAPIVGDSYLEQSLTFTTNSRHYIGALETRRSHKQQTALRGQPYLPVRLAPSAENLKKGWDDVNYSVTDRQGGLHKVEDKESRGITIALGTEINVVEIVESKTGTWVGFVFEGHEFNSSFKSKVNENFSHLSSSVLLYALVLLKFLSISLSLELCSE